MPDLPPALQGIQRILVVLVRGGMGDVLLSTPVIQALAERYREAAVDVMVRTGARAMVERHPAVAETLAVTEGDLDSRAGFRRWLDELRRRRYTMALVLWSKFSEAWLLYRAGIPHRVGQDSRLTYSWTYTHRIRVRSEHGDNTSHWVQCQLDYARAVGADLAAPFPRLYLDDAARTAVREHGLTPGAYTLLHPGRGIPLNAQRMPSAPFAATADALTREFDRPVVLTGGPDEQAWVDTIAAGATSGRVINLAGKLTVPHLGAILEQAAVVVANDSGPMHMAAGLGVPTVGIFAMEKDLPARWGPASPGTTARNVIVRPSAFRCRADCLKETCPRMVCYEDIHTDDVVRAARQAMAAHAKSPPVFREG